MAAQVIPTYELNKSNLRDSKNERTHKKINLITDLLGTSSVEASEIANVYEILDYAIFTCGDLVLKYSETNVIRGGDVFVNGNIDLEASSDLPQIQNGNVYASGNIKISGNSSITGGNAFANANIDVLSSASPNIAGNATTGGIVSGSGTVSGTISQGVLPVPVIDQCVGTNLAGITITLA